MANWLSKRFFVVYTVLKIIVIISSIAVLSISSFLIIFAFDSPSGIVINGLLTIVAGFVAGIWGLFCAADPQKVKRWLISYNLLKFRPEIIIQGSVYILSVVYLTLYGWYVWMILTME